MVEYWRHSNISKWIVVGRCQVFLVLFAPCSDEVGQITVS